MGICCELCFFHKSSETAARNEKAGFVRAHLGADIAHTLWVKDHPGKGHPNERKAYGDTST